MPVVALIIRYYSCWGQHDGVVNVWKLCVSKLIWGIVQRFLKWFLKFHRRFYYFLSLPSWEGKRVAAHNEKQYTDEPRATMNKDFTDENRAARFTWLTHSTNEGELITGSHLGHGCHGEMCRINAWWCFQNVYRCVWHICCPKLGQMTLLPSMSNLLWHGSLIMCNGWLLRDEGLLMRASWVTQTVNSVIIYSICQLMRLLSRVLLSTSTACIF